MDFCNYTSLDRIVPGFERAMDEIEEKNRLSGNELASDVELLSSLGNRRPEKGGRKLFPMDQEVWMLKFVAESFPLTEPLKVRILNGAHTALFRMPYLQCLRTQEAGLKISRMGDYLKKGDFWEFIPSMDFDETE